MRTACVCSMLACLCVLPGCLSVNVESDHSGPGHIEMDGLITGMADLNGIAPYDGTLLRFGILTNTPRPGELIGLDIWPLAGVGIGFVGARVQLLPLQVGVGALCYEPRDALNKPTHTDAPPEQSPAPPAPPPPPAPEKQPAVEAKA